MSSIEYMDEEEIVDAINSEDEFGGDIDDDDLTDSESWRYICKVRGRHFNDVDPFCWSALCSRRGKLL